MEFLSSRVFWGIIVLLIGLSIILNALFKINLPLFRIAIALALIYFGVNLLIGSFRTSPAKDGTTIFSNSKAAPTLADLKKEYSAVFGSMDVDLSNLRLEEDRNVEINAIFGSVTVFVSRQQPYRIKGSAVFGSVKMPNGSNTVFGDQTVTNENNSSPGTLWIDANGVFGEVKIIAIE